MVQTLRDWLGQQGLGETNAAIVASERLTEIG